jgi:hypothetical protein
VTQRILVACLVLSALDCIASDPAQSTGVLQGHLKIVSLQTVAPSDGIVPTVTAQTYAEYPLVILSSDGKQQIAVITADAKGSYRVELPAGTYILDIRDRVRKHVRAKPRVFTIASNQTVNLDLEMDTGIR